jgi:hypothetical protein
VSISINLLMILPKLSKTYYPPLQRYYLNIIFGVVLASKPLQLWDLDSIEKLLIQYKLTPQDNKKNYLISFH